VHFSKIARSAVIAHARTSETSEGLRAKLKEAGKVVFDVVVEVRDEAGTDVAKVTVAWHVATK
jgi:hypothetical protein